MNASPRFALFLTLANMWRYLTSLMLHYSMYRYKSTVFDFSPSSAFGVAPGKGSSDRGGGEDHTVWHYRFLSRETGRDMAHPKWLPRCPRRRKPALPCLHRNGHSQSRWHLQYSQWHHTALLSSEGWGNMHRLPGGAPDLQPAIQQVCYTDCSRWDFIFSFFKLWIKVIIHAQLYICYVMWISQILFPAAPSQPLYSAVTLIAVTSVISLLVVASVIGGSLLLYRYFFKGMCQCEKKKSACYVFAVLHLHQ